MRATPHTYAKHAFSLVELSIVLVILGLLVGGILSGKSLIRAAELRSIMTQADGFKAATRAFRDKYFALPGDILNATSFWQRQDGGADCITRSSASVATPGTCDGNGDGIIEYGPDPSRPSEGFQAWRHLSLAGLIEGSFTGMAGVTHTWWGGTCQACEHDPGVNVPKSKAGNAGWAITYINNISMASASFYLIDYADWLSVGADDGWRADGGFLATSEAWGIDGKADDGLPGSGFIHSVPACSVANNNSNFTSPYNLTSTTTLCPLVIKR